MVAARAGKVGRLQTDTARDKRAAYFSSELHKSRARQNALALAKRRRSGELPPQMKICDTKPELAVEVTLDSIGVRFIKQQTFGPYTFDFYLPDHKILLEVQGEYWHSLPKNIANDLAKASFIEHHYQDLQLKYISESEAMAKNRLFAVLKEFTGATLLSENVDFNAVSIKAVSDDIAKDFLARYHYLTRFRKNTKICVGAYYKEELISIAAFTQPSYNSVVNRHGLPASAVVELSRFVIGDKYHTKNLASWILSRCVRLLKTRCKEVMLLVSFADPHFGHNGTIYLASNWCADGMSKPSYYYTDSGGGIIHKKVVWDHAKKFGVSEGDYANTNGLSRIVTEPKRRFIYWLRQPNIKKDINKQVEAICAICTNKFFVSSKALSRAISRHGYYICHSCSISKCWNAGTYKNRPKSVKTNREEYIDVECRCGAKNRIKRKSLKEPYRCHSCAMKEKWKNVEYIAKQKECHRNSNKADTNEFVDAVCSVCGAKNRIKRKSLKEPYRCHSCAMKEKWKNVEYIAKQKECHKKLIT